MEKIFTDRLREARGAESQSFSAKKLGISQVRLSNYESGKREPDIPTLKRIAKIYSVSADWLLGLTDERTPGRQVVTTASGLVAAAGNATATLHAAPPATPPPPSADVSRLLNIIESQQRVIESLSKSKE